MLPSSMQAFTPCRTREVLPAPTNAASGAKSRAASNAKPASRAKAGANPVHKDAVAAKSAHRATTEAEPHKKPRNDPNKSLLKNRLAALDCSHLTALLPFCQEFLERFF